MESTASADLSFARSAELSTLFYGAGDLASGYVGADHCRELAGSPIGRLWPDAGDHHSVAVHAPAPVEPLRVVDCNRNGSGLQAARCWDHINCLYRHGQDTLTATETAISR